MLSQNRLEKFQSIMGREKALIGMVHLLPLPGTPSYGGSLQAIVDAALRDAATLKEAGFDALLLENMHDLPYLNREVGHEVSSAMTMLGYLIKRAFNLPTGIQILAGANHPALAAAHAAGLDFIRAEGFVFGHLADEGWMNSDAGPLLRYRKQIGAEHIAIFTDIKKKHSAHAVSADVSLAETAEAALFFQSDGLIITGNSTGKAASSQDLQSLQHIQAPILVGSGITVGNCLEYKALSQGLIVGSSLKLEGNWENAVEYERAAALASAFNSQLS